jgi:acetolactate synthase-1/2/3 large subunit
MPVTKYTVARLILDQMKAVGIDSLYCLPGVQNDDFFNTVYDYTSEFKVVATRHEQGAAYMALGAALATGKPQAYSVVPGPGMLNAAAAHATAFGLSVPLLALVGQILSPMVGEMYGMLHEIPDQLAILKQFSKYAEGIYDAKSAAEQIGAAMNTLVNGMPRPVSLEVPMDIWNSNVPPESLPSGVQKTTPVLDEQTVQAAAKLLGIAERPLIFLGGGAQDASEPIRQMVDLIQAPFTSNRMGHGIVDERHPLAAPWPVAHELWKTADVVLAIGTRLQAPQMTWGVDDRLKIIHINLDPNEIGRHDPVAIGMVADARQAVMRLVDEVKRLNKQRPSRAPELKQLRTKFHEKIAGLEPQLSYLAAIREALPDDGVLVEDLTQVGYVSRFAYPVYQPRTLVSPGYPGTLGWGFATALGVQHALPHRKVVSISGDGGFLYTASEIATAVKYNIPITAIVFADGAFGNVKRIQQQKFAGRVIASDLVNPDFLRLAESFGAVGMRAHDPGELKGVLREALQTDAPTIIEVPVGEMPSPWEHIFLPAVRGGKSPY